jgi:excisionase family DNA binding protein
MTAQASFMTDRVPGGRRARLDRLRDALPELDLLTADDVCELLKVKKSWLYDTVEAGTIAVIRLGKQLRFQPSAISDYLATQRSGTLAGGGASCDGGDEYA